MMDKLERKKTTTSTCGRDRHHVVRRYSENLHSGLRLHHSPFVVVLTYWQNKKLTELKELADLTLDIDGGEDCISLDEKDYGDGKGKVPRCHIRFRLSVKGSPNGAKKCDVKLMRVHRIESNGTLQPISYPNQQYLHWNGQWKRDQHTERDLNHGSDQYVHFLKIEDIGGNVSVRVKDVADTILPIQMGGIYRFEVKATAGNARAVGRMVEVVLGLGFVGKPSSRTHS